MGDTVTIRLTEELAAWLRTTARKTGVPVSQLVREHLERAKLDTAEKPFLRFAGIMSGPSDLSSRKGYSKK
jgi:predicted DNA-binding protein